MPAGYWLDGCTADPTGDAGIVRSLIQFDLASVPAPLVKSATLHVSESGYCGYKDAAPPTVRAFRVTEPWSEGTVTWDTAPAYAEGYGSVTINYADLVWDWYSLDVTGLVNLWLQGTPNHGLALRGYEGTDSNAIVTLFDQTGTGYGPYLVVEYYGPNTR